ncbi:MAG: type II toxin-antitoxin system prevent-host-death family antitoxin [bacterium]|nr:type II toxin-antitoxin system prevent-host-death family antitoxin [bacterium]
MGIAISILKAEHIGIRNLKMNLSKLLKADKPYIVTEHGRPKQIIIPYHEMMELIDIFDELSEPDLLETIREGREAINLAKGNDISASTLWEEMKI